jgi:hypothetical protein
VNRIVLLPLPETEWSRRVNDRLVPLASTDIVYSTDPQSTMRRVIDEAYAALGKTTAHITVTKGA